MMQKISRFLVSVGFLFVLVGCGSNTFAPVDEGWQKPGDVGGVYQAKKGETLQDVAWRFNINVNRLATINNMTPTYPLQRGQIVYLTAQAKAQAQAANSLPNQENRTNEPSEAATSDSHLTVEPIQGSESEKMDSSGGVTSMVATSNSENNQKDKVKQGNWQWPLHGQVVGKFSENGSKGMEIQGSSGESVSASKGGQVVYAGNGLPGYGNLVMIKHPDGLMSIYAQNSKLLVKEGEHVQAGQSIAEAGSKPIHFEIRKAGKPVDPAAYLGN